MPYREPARRNTRYLRLCLDVLTTPTPCDMPWEIMEGSECMRVCPECARHVHDVTMMDAIDAEAFLADHMGEPPKLRLHRRPDGTLIDAECARGARQRQLRRLGSVVGVALAIGVVAALLR